MSVLKKITKLSWTPILSGLSTFAVRFLLLSLFVFLSLVIYRGLQQTGYQVQPFFMPKAISEAGYSGEVMALLVQDRVEDLKVLANSVREDSLQINAQLKPELNLDVMGVGLSANSIIYHLRELIGRPTYSISGNVTEIDDEMGLFIRMTDYESNEFHATVNDGNRQEALQSLIDKGARYILKNTDPYRLAVVYYKEGDVDKSEEFLRYIIENRPIDKKWAYHFWANISRDNSNNERAMEFFDLAIQEDPNFLLPLNAKAWTLFEEEKYDDALPIFERILSLKSDHGSANNGAAFCHKFLGNIQKAESYYKNQIKLFPDNIYSYGNYSSFLISTKNDTAGAVEVWEDAASNIDQSGDYYMSLGAVYKLQKDTVSAMKALKDALLFDPENVIVLRQYSNYLFYVDKNYEEAEKYIRRSTKILEKGGFERGMKVDAYNTLAIAQYSQGNLDSAYVSIDKALKLSPDSPFPLSTLAEIYLLDDKLKEFYSTIEKAIEAGLPMEQFLNEHPYTLIKDQSKLIQMIDAQKDKVALKG